MSFVPGTQLGPYQLAVRIGEGGMGEVWKARDTRLDRTVAIKLSKQEFTERFEREARAIAALNHPNICHLYDVGPNYLVMEYIEGAPLKGPLPVEKAVEYAGQILEALDAAHKKGITHRDLKPANILVTKQGIKLLDFGLAKQAGAIGETDATVTQALTAEGQIAGTLQYMSPEQLQAKGADARSDIFAFGCVLYEMISGKRAFAGESAASVVAAILEREPAPLEVEPPLGRVIARCLAKNPDERFQGARDLKAALLWAIEEPPVSPAKAAIPWPRFTAAIAALMVLSLAAGWFLKPPPEERLLTVSLTPPPETQFVSGMTNVNEGGFALSPDGAMVAFVARKGNRSQIWVRRMDSEEASALAGTEEGFLPFWSPDSRWIGFFTLDKLKKVEAAGGSVTVICAVDYGRGGTWNEDGVILFGRSQDGIYRVSAEGGRPEPVLGLDASREETSLRHPSFLPDGRHFTFAVRSRVEKFTGIAVGSLDPKEKPSWVGRGSSQAMYAPPLRDSRVQKSSGHLVLIRDESLVALPFDPKTLRVLGENIRVVPGRRYSGNLPFSISNNGMLLYASETSAEYRLLWRDRKGLAIPSVAPQEVEFYTEHRISPNGKRIAYVKRSEAEGGIIILDLETSFRMQLPTGGRFPLWSSDGSTFIELGRVGNLLRRAATGVGSPEELAILGSRASPMDLSGDGKHLLYAGSTSETGVDLMVQPMAEGGKPYPYLRTKAGEGHGQFSPGIPRWIAYSRNDTGTREVYVQPFTPGQPASSARWQISVGGGTMPRWRADGKELFYLTLGGEMMAVAVKGDGEVFQAGQPTPLFSTTASTSGQITFSYDVTPDGQRFALTEPDPRGVSSPLILVTNWLRKARRP